MSSSFETINYGLRPNKAVERKLIFDAFGRLGPVLDLHDYRYLGLGAILFVDFIMAHQALRITNMISIERQKNAERAEKNKPFSCIKVIRGDSTVVLTGMDIDLPAQKTIAWMDYDGPADENVVSDIDVLCTKLPLGSFVIVTANAVRDNYRVDSEEEEGKKLGLEDSVKKLFGALVPDDVPESYDSLNGFPPVLTKILIQRCRSITAESRADASFFPLFNYIYKDGTAPMVTVGGLIGGQAIVDKVKATGLPAMEVYSAAEPYVLELPVLTPRERIALCSMMPSSAVIEAKQVRKALGFDLRPGIVEEYRKLYRFYPQYSEIAAFA